MKNIFLLLAALAFAVSATAQDLRSDQVPSVVKNTFSRSYPKASTVDWEKKGTLYNADFEISGVDHEVWINAKGVIVREKQDVNNTDLPAVITTAIKSKYPSHRIDDVDQYKEGKNVFYKVELDKAGKDIHVIFDHTGKLSTKRFD